MTNKVNIVVQQEATALSSHCWTRLCTLSCTSTTWSRPWALSTRSTSGGRSTWPPCKWLVVQRCTVFLICHSTFSPLPYESKDCTEETVAYIIKTAPSCSLFVGRWSRTPVIKINTVWTYSICILLNIQCSSNTVPVYTKQFFLLFLYLRNKKLTCIMMKMFWCLFGCVNSFFFNISEKLVLQGIGSSKINVGAHKLELMFSWLTWLHPDRQPLKPILSGDGLLRFLDVWNSEIRVGAGIHEVEPWNKLSINLCHYCTVYMQREVLLWSRV